MRLFVSSRILLRWHADLARWRWAYPRRTPGRPRMPQALRALALKMARDNPARGYRRIHGELAGVAAKVSALLPVPDGLPRPNDTGTSHFRLALRYALRVWPPGSTAGWVRPGGGTHSVTR
jgi:hypothetical protein